MQFSVSVAIFILVQNRLKSLFFKLDEDFAGKQFSLTPIS